MTLQARVPVEMPASEVRTASTTQPLSMRLWGLDWRSCLPWRFESVVIEHGTFEDAIPFMERHYSSIFGFEPERFLVEEMTDAKRRFWREMDVFVFRTHGETVGISAGHPSDWSTFYHRTIAILPEYRERGMAAHFFRRVFDALTEVGVGRWEGDVSPANAAILRTLLRHGALVTATSNSERWGSLLRLTKFLREDAGDAFARQFLYVPAFGRNPQPK